MVVDCRVVRVALLIALLLATLAFGEGLPVLVDPPADPGREAALLLASNEARAEHGLAPLGRDEGLARAARAHASEMATLGYFSHNSPTPASATLSRRLARAGVPSVTAGENLALLRGQQDIAAAAVGGWLESPGHRAALLSRQYSHVGFGVAEGHDGQLFVAQVFARQPRRLQGATVAREPKAGFELDVVLNLPARLTVLPRLASHSGEATTLGPGLQQLTLHAESGDTQQLIVASALDQAGHYVIQDGGWVTPASGAWRRDDSMPRSSLAIASVTVKPAQNERLRVELEYGPAGPRLAVFIDGVHYRDAEQTPGRLLLHLPSNTAAVIQVGEVSGSLVTPFDAFRIVASPAGPRLVAGKTP
jgi:uncharacterized protein YkwD